MIDLHSYSYVKHSDSGKRKLSFPYTFPPKSARLFSSSLFEVAYAKTIFNHTKAKNEESLQFHNNLSQQLVFINKVAFFRKQEVNSGMKDKSQLLPVCFGLTQSTSAYMSKSDDAQ